MKIRRQEKMDAIHSPTSLDGGVVKVIKVGNGP